MRKLLYVILTAFSINCYGNYYESSWQNECSEKYYPWTNASNFYSPWDKGEQILFYTLPKSGSHLFQKVFRRLLKKDYKMLHIHEQMSVDLIQGRSSGKAGVTIRDPRGQIVSLRNYLTKLAKSDPTHKSQNFLKLSEIEKLRFLITNPDSPEDTFYNLCSEAMKNPNILIVRFEDFIESKGGGDDAIQRKTIRKVCNFFGHSISEKELDYCQKHYWGDSYTFHKGQIGSWKTELDKENIFLLKERWNNYIMEWGYEADEDWIVNYL